MSEKSTRKRNRLVSKSIRGSTKSSTDVNWRETKTAEECLSHLCLSKHLSDISFTFKDSQNVKLPAHKFVLSMRSTVFETMFYGSLAECGDTVLIEDVDPETMKVFMRFAYSDKPGLDGNNVLPCLYAAKKYALTGLVRQCSDFLEDSIDSKNVCSIHKQAVFYDMKPLQDICFDYILEYASDTLSSEDFLEVSHMTLLNILRHDELATNEVDVFNAAVRWSKNYCKAKKISPNAANEREALGIVLYQIRFPIMPIEEFDQVVTPAGILTNAEQELLYQFNATKGSSPVGRFINRERCGEVVTIDISKYTLSQYQGTRRQAYYLQIQCQYQYDNYGRRASSTSTNRLSLKIRSIRGAFVKNVRRIALGNASVTNYKTVGNKITFKYPLEMAVGGTIQFHSNDTESSCSSEAIPGCISYRTDIQEVVNGRNVNFVQIPAGMESISFVKG